MFTDILDLIPICYNIGQNQAMIISFLKMLFEEPTWVFVVNLNLKPTPTVATGVKGVYRSMWEQRVSFGLN